MKMYDYSKYVKTENIRYYQNIGVILLPLNNSCATTHTHTLQLHENITDYATEKNSLEKIMCIYVIERKTKQ